MASSAFDIFKEQSVTEGHAVLRRVIEEVALADTVPTGSSVAQGLEKLKSGTGLFNDPCAERLLESVLFRTSGQNTELTLDEREDLMQTCDELRLHLIASALTSAKLRGSGAEEQQNLDDSLSGLAAAGSLTVVRESKLTHCLVGSTRVIIVSRVSEEQECHDIYNGLLTIEDRRRPGESWVIDLSLLRSLPMLLLANLVAYAGKLREHDKDMFLGWVRPEMFSGSQFARVEQFFSLKPFGGYYFSVYEKD